MTDATVPHPTVSLSNRYRRWLLSGDGWFRHLLMGIEIRWMQRRWEAPLARARLRYLCDRPDRMTTEQWNQWLNSMPQDEFIALMLTRAPEVPEVPEPAVDDDDWQPALAPHVGTDREMG